MCGSFVYFFHDSGTCAVIINPGCGWIPSDICIDCDDAASGANILQRHDMRRVDPQRANEDEFNDHDSPLKRK